MVFIQFLMKAIILDNCFKLSDDVITEYTAQEKTHCARIGWRFYSNSFYFFPFVDYVFVS